MWTIALVVQPFDVVGAMDVDPPGWWSNLEGGQVEVLISGADLGAVENVTCDDDDVKVMGWRPAALDGHVWVELDLHAATLTRRCPFNSRPNEADADRCAFRRPCPACEPLRSMGRSACDVPHHA